MSLLSSAVRGVTGGGSSQRRRPSTPATAGQPLVPLPGVTGSHATGPYSGAINAYETARGQANQANETRYQGILGTLQGQGVASKTEIARSGQEERGQGAQSLIDRGLYGTTALDAMNNQSRDREGRQAQSVDENVANQVAGVMERRTDQGPDAQFYGQLLSQQAAGDAGNQRSNTFMGAASGGGNGGMGDFGGGQGGNQRDRQQEQQQQRGGGYGGGGGGGGGAGNAIGYSGGGGAGPYSSVNFGNQAPGGTNYSGSYAQSFGGDGVSRVNRPDPFARGGSNSYLGANGSVTSGARNPANPDSTLNGMTLDQMRGGQVGRQGGGPYSGAGNQQGGGTAPNQSDQNLPINEGPLDGTGLHQLEGSSIIVDQAGRPVARRWDARLDR